MKSKILFILTLTTFIFSCGNSQSEPMTLNNGEKWKIDDNMIVHIQNMDNDVKTFDAKDLAEYKALSKNLKKNISLLTSNCTMTGQAHDELHKWLVPYMGLVDEFAETKTAQEANQAFKKIETSFKTFNQYFQ